MNAVSGAPGAMARRENAACRDGRGCVRERARGSAAAGHGDPLGSQDGGPMSCPATEGTGPHCGGRRCNSRGGSRVQRPTRYFPHLPQCTHRKRGASPCWTIQAARHKAIAPPPPPTPPAWLSFPLALSLSRSPPPSPTLIRPAPPSDSGGRAARVVDCDINRGRESSAMRRAVCREAGLRFVVCLVFDNDVDMYLKFATNT